MTDLSVAKPARMACRIRLDLFEAGPEGAPILEEDAFGPGEDPAADVAVAVIARFVDDTVLDEPGHAGEVPHHALMGGLRARMEERSADGGAGLADGLRGALAGADRGVGRRPD